MDCLENVEDELIDVRDYKKHLYEPWDIVEQKIVFTDIINLFQGRLNRNKGQREIETKGYEDIMWEVNKFSQVDLFENRIRELLMREREIKNDLCEKRLYKYIFRDSSFKEINKKIKCLKDLKKNDEEKQYKDKIEKIIGQDNFEYYFMEPIKSNNTGKKQKTSVCSSRLISTFDNILKKLLSAYYCCVNANLFVNRYDSSFAMPFYKRVIVHYRIVRNIRFIELVKLLINKIIEYMGLIEHPDDTIQEAIKGLKNTLEEHEDDYIKYIKKEHYYFKLTSKYQAGEVMTHIREVKETHEQGLTYYTLMNNMHYLEGDFEDSYSHFNIAFERMLLNNGVFERMEKNLQELLEP